MKGIIFSLDLHWSQWWQNLDPNWLKLANRLHSHILKLSSITNSGVCKLCKEFAICASNFADDKCNSIPDYTSVQWVLAHWQVHYICIIWIEKLYLFFKYENCYVLKTFKSIQDLSHWFGTRLLFHGTNAQEDLPLTTVLLKWEKKTPMTSNTFENMAFSTDVHDSLWAKACMVKYPVTLDMLHHNWIDWTDDQWKCSSATSIHFLQFEMTTKQNLVTLP